MKNIITLITATLLATGIYSQTPQKMSYQAVVRDATDNLVTNTTVGMQISILQHSATGTSVYTETQAPESNANGLVSVEIGTGTVVTGNFALIDWANGPYYIKTKLDPTGGTNYTITGISQLLSVPYALYAAKSSDSSLWKPKNDNIFYKSGNVGIGTENPSSVFQVNRNNSEFRMSDTIGYTQLKIYNKTDGIAGIILDASDGDGVGSDYYQIYQDNDLQLNIESMAFANDIVFRTKPGIFHTPEKESMRLTKEGDLGIGTSEPHAKLEITDGDVYINDITKGIIMKSPDGQCWRVTVDNSGNLVSSSTTCP